MIDRYPYIKTLLQIQAGRYFEGKPFTVIDVGAYLGDSCVHLARKFQQAKVIAVEPFQANLDHLMRRVKRIPNIIVKSVAITSRGGRAKLSAPSDGNPQLSATLHGDGNGVEVTCMTLPNLCKACGIDYPDMLLMNCEGAEYSIFKHRPSREAIEKVAVLDLSMHGKGFIYNQPQFATQRKQINDFLLEHGFELVYGEQVKTITATTGHIRQVWTRK